MVLGTQLSPVTFGVGILIIIMAIIFVINKGVQNLKIDKAKIRIQQGETVEGIKDYKNCLGNMLNGGVNMTQHVDFLEAFYKKRGLLDKDLELNLKLIRNFQSNMERTSDFKHLEAKCNEAIKALPEV